MGLSQTAKRPVRGRQARARQWLIPLLIGGLGAVAALLGHDALPLLRYDRQGLQNGELWRLLSGHVVHLGWAHFALNATGLALVWLLVGNALGTGRWCIGIIGMVAAIDLGFWFLEPQLAWYVGLSGVLHGVLVAGLILDFDSARVENLIVLLLVAAKLAYEQWFGPLPGSESSAGGPVVVNAHLYGAIAGAALAAIYRIRVPADPAI